MSQLTYDLVKQFAIHARDDYAAALVNGAGELEAAGINTPLRLAHFMAQIAHESGGFTIVRENTGWTPAQIKGFTGSRYANLHPSILLCRGDAQKLANVVYAQTNGNTGGNDGWDYRGGGLIQLTGRENYRACGNALGVDLEGRPRLIEDAGIALRAALWEWSYAGVNTFADHNYGRTIGNAINRGNPFSRYDPIGHQSREQWFRRAWAVFGGGQPLPQEEALHLGAYGGIVRRIQGQLRDLGYGVGDQDGVYGPTMARAVAGFKLDQKRALGVELEPDEVLGPLSMAALDTAVPVLLSPDRESATMADLTALGSTEMAAGGHQQAVGRGLTAVGFAAGAHQIGALDGLADQLQQITLLQSTAAPAIKAIGWGMANFWWMLLIGAGVYCWRSGYGVKLARLAAHQLGFNLWR